MRQHIFRILLSCSFLIFVAACSSQSPVSQPSAKPAPHPTITAAPSLPAGTVLYQAGGTQGFSHWKLSGGWHVTNGQLEVKASSPISLLIPYQPVVANYVIEVRLQVVRLSYANGGDWVITAEKQPGKDGYIVGIGGLKGPGPQPPGSHGEVETF